MLLQSLRLKHIRSYTDEKITFPDGIVLLAGDIGAGKSTILLAIEFALFGLMRSELSGTALLRNGSREGLVELTFSLDKKTYTIGRTLKRSKTSVEQDAGYVIEDGLRREATAIELKTIVLNLLGYPPELVTKHKSLMYRYTVYTPQEDMKKIITEDKESRLQILRKVFDIDKYKRIADNAAAYAKELRGNMRDFEGKLSDEAQKKQHWAEKHKQSETVQHALLDIQPRLQAAKQAVAQQKTALDALEQQRAAIVQHRIALQAAETELSSLVRNKSQSQTELTQMTALLATQPTLPAQTPESILQSVQQKQQELLRIDAELRTHITAHAELRAHKQLSERTMQKILDMAQCPTCLRPVDDAHKHAFAQQEQQKLADAAVQLDAYASKVTAHEQTKQRAQQDIATLQQQHASAREAHIKHQQFQLNQQRKTQLDTRLSEIAQSMTAADARKQQAVAALHAGAALETQFLAEKGKLDTLHHQEQTVVVQHATLIEQAKQLREMIQLLEKDLEAKKHARAQLERLSVLHQWVGDFFSNLMTVMEKHVMTKVYHEFNGLFRQWFGLLIEDDILVGRLDEEFSPMVQQNGYDTEVANLSGGEKTACALAYRLALNKVITALRSTIHTKDLLILDEPTDGFSADQIDRMRDVLDQLRARQIVIVSHEAKIEGLADHVLRVVKEEHSSRVLV